MHLSVGKCMPHYVLCCVAIILGEGDMYTLCSPRVRDTSSLYIAPVSSAWPSSRTLENSKSRSNAVVHMKPGVQHC